MRIMISALGLAVLAACSSATANRGSVMGGSADTGGPNARAAVDGFFAAMKTGDIQAAAGYWGSNAGSSRETVPRDQLETRILVMQRCLNHDRIRVTESPFQRTDSAFYKVEITRGDLLGTTDVVVVPGPSRRWYVAQTNLEAVAPLCRA